VRYRGQNCEIRTKTVAWVKGARAARERMRREETIFKSREGVKEERRVDALIATNRIGRGKVKDQGEKKNGSDPIYVDADV